MSEHERERGGIVVTRGVQALVMAGGEGSRLRPLTSNTPKPMLPVANRPIMEHIVGLLRGHGFTDIVATVQFLSSIIRNYFGDGSDLGVSLSYSTEEVPLGTAGSVLNARDLLAGTVLVISGDALTDVDLTEAIAFHREKEASATLVLKRMQDPLEFGIVMTSEDGRIERFLEKPTWGQVFSDTVNTGIYVLEPEVLDMIPPDQPHDFSSELFPAMLDKGLPVYGFVTDAYWTDVGNTEAFLGANYDALDRKVELELSGFELQPEVWVGDDAEIHPTARIEGPALIGDNTRVGAGAVIGPHSVVGDNAIIGDDARLARAVVMDRAHVGSLAQVRGGVVGVAAAVHQGATLEEGAVLGDEVVVGSGALVKPAVKIYQSRTVEAGAIVTQSVVRERRASRSLFGARGVSGLVNVGITAQVAVRLGMAYGTTLPRGSVVVTGRDASRAARTMKRAVIAGLNSTGVHCHDLELMPTPVTRFTVRSQQAAGGVSVRTSPGDPEVVEIRLFDEEGADLGAGAQRKIDRVYFREDYRRPGPMRLGELTFPPHALEQYTSGLLRAVDLDAIRAAQIKVVVDYAYGPTSVIGPAVLGRLGCQALTVNAFTDESRLALTSQDLASLLAQLADHVRKSGSDAGVLIEPGGEVAHLVDGVGRRVTHLQALLAFLSHEASAGDGTVAVPVSAPQACERAASEAGAKLQWTSTSPAALMGRAARPGVAFAGDGEGTVIFSSFMPAPDALMTFCKTLELIAVAKRGLDEVIDDLPAVHMATIDVPVPWQLKGTVMREVASASVPGRLKLLDGVKVIEEGRWALVIPHPEDALCRVWAEASSEADAEALARRFAALVERVVTEARAEATY
ncbi:MAG: sugar phosphate nucleotidyltransferase [Actinomycetota bacterium]